MSVKALPKWAVEAHRRGETAHVDGEMIAPPTRDGLITTLEENVSEIHDQFRSELEQKDLLLDEKQAEIDELRAQLAARSKPGPKPKEEKPEGKKDGE